jgi:hypothetical protein
VIGLLAGGIKHALDPRILAFALLRSDRVMNDKSRPTMARSKLDGKPHLDGVQPCSV